MVVVTALIVAGMNAVNLCAPGWCGWYGFPFPYHAWSDAMMTFNGVCTGCPSYRPFAAIVNVLLAIGTCVLVFRTEQKRAARGPVV
jgi:hypothetical protein